MPILIASTPTPRGIMREQPRKPSFQFSESFKEKHAMATSRVWPGPAPSNTEDNSVVPCS